MKLLLRLAILVSLSSAGFAAYGLGLRVLGYVTYGAFGQMFRAAADPSLDRGIMVWIAYVLASIGATIWLFLLDRRSARSRKSG